MNRCLAKLQFEAITDRHMGKRRSGGCADVDLRARARCQLFVPRDEIPVKMCFEDVTNRATVFGRCFQVQIDIALRIDHHRFAFGSQHVRCVGKTP